ncbi:MAG: DNA alkylation repair protein [Clostridiales bacterium]|nr:DNA alkylation repair protein [Clostridiales bacterium]
MRADELFDALFKNQDEAYRQMQIRLLPNIAPDTIIGVRTPVLRGIAKELEDSACFLKALPHGCFEENQIHCFLLEREKDFEFVISEIERFLPYVDNWATCDQLRPRCFRKNREALLPYIRKWIASEEPYTIRFGIGMLMVHFLGDDYDKTLLELPAGVHSEEYYVRMMIAWFFATALAKQYDDALPYITAHRLDKWIHNKTIQKAVESDRVTPEHKRALVNYRLK